MRHTIDTIFRRYPSGTNWSDLAILRMLSRPHRWRLIAALLCSLALSGINGVIAWSIKPLTDLVLMEKSREYLLFISIGAVLLFCLRGGFTFAANYLMGSIGAKIVRALRQWLYEKLLRLPYGFHVRTSSSSLVSKTMNDVEVLHYAVAHTIKDLLVETGTLLVLMGVAISRKWDLALLAFVVVPLTVFAIARLGGRLKRMSMAARLLVAQLTTILQESLLGLKIIRAFTMETHMAKRFDNVLAEHYRAVMRGVRVNEFSSLLSEVLGGIGIAVILFYSLHLVIVGEMTPGDLLSFVAAILMVYTPLRRLSRVHGNFQQARAVLERLRDIGLQEPEPQGGHPVTLQGRIELRDISFRYPGADEDALHSVNLSVRPGDLVALVGYSGAGKSTLADLIAGFWRPSAGKLLYEDRAMQELSPASLRSQIGIVTQDVFLFDDSILENIRFGHPDASAEEVIAAAKAAFAHEFIMELPQGYETRIGERGVRLSGGQKQRITIARAILRNPSVLILDEATSSLDMESEHQVQKALDVLMQDRTTLVIAHRLSTIQKANRIVVMSQGTIIQQGSHDDLLAQGGLYAELYAMQFRTDDAEPDYTRQ